MEKVKMLRYEMSEEVVNYILNALNRTQIAGVNQAQDLLTVVNIMKNPLNASEFEKEQLEALKGKYEKKANK
jgi:hypothetical protein